MDFGFASRPGHIKDLCSKITRIDKDGALTGENVSELVNFVTREVRKDNGLVWNHEVKIEFFYPDERKLGEPYILKITWTPEGHNKVCELDIPLENFRYTKQ